MKRLLIFLHIIIAIFFLSVDAYATSLEQANKSFAHKDYDQAATQYNELLMKSPGDELLHYNLACALYAKGDYQAALENFQKALLSEDSSLEAKALYNLANSKYRIAKSKEQTDLSSAIDIMRESLDYYKRAIAKDLGLDDAKFNHEFVEKEIKRLLDELKNQEQNQQCENKEESQEKNQEEQKEKNSSSKSENMEQGQNQEQESKEENEEDQAKSGEESQAKSAQEEDQQESNEEESSERSSNFEMSKEEAENLLDKFSMQESDEMLKPKQEIRRRSAVFKDW